MGLGIRVQGFRAVGVVVCGQKVVLSSVLMLLKYRAATYSESGEIPVLVVCRFFAVGDTERSRTQLDPESSALDPTSSLSH